MSNNLNRLCGVEPLTTLKPLPPFDMQVLDFLAALSAALLKDKEAKAYPDVVTFAFFCRRANLEAMRGDYEGRLEGRLGRGIAFHIAPSNVPINFAYSLVASLLAGNGNIVKASSRNFAQTRIVCRAIEGLLAGEYSALASYCCVVTYPREEQALTERYSALCNVRIIWGGDETVRRVRQAAIPPRAFDVTFADRYSLLCIDPQAVIAMDDKALNTLAQGFYNDTYLTDQNACTSPRLIIWLGREEGVCPARERFWNAIHAYASTRYGVEPVVAVDKLTAACRAAIELEDVSFEAMPDNLVTRIQLQRLAPGMESFRSAGGFFVEYVSQSLDALAQVVDARYQTLSYIGLDPAELRELVTANGLRGIDRITPVGHTMDFSLSWDGYDLIQTLSRQIGIM